MSQFETSMSSASGAVKTRCGGESRGEEFVGQHAHVLRVVLELDDVGVAVGAQHQLALCAAPHAPDMLHRQNRHARSPLFRVESLSRILSVRNAAFCCSL